jgi:DNA sulfur modification protein DndE
MANKLRVSKRTQQIFSKVGATNSLPPFALAKLAIALSVRKGPLHEKDYGTDNEGQELNRQTIFGDHDLIFKCLIMMNAGEALTEDEYFPKTVKAHLDRGAQLLENEDRYTKNLCLSLCNLDKTI